MKKESFFQTLLTNAFQHQLGGKSYRQVQRYKGQTEAEREARLTAAQARREHRMKRPQGWSGHGQ